MKIELARLSFKWFYQQTGPFRLITVLSLPVTLIAPRYQGFGAHRATGIFHSHAPHMKIHSHNGSIFFVVFPAKKRKPHPKIAGNERVQMINISSFRFGAAMIYGVIEPKNFNNEKPGPLMYYGNCLSHGSTFNSAEKSVNPMNETRTGK